MEKEHITFAGLTGEVDIDMDKETVTVHDYKRIYIAWAFSKEGKPGILGIFEDEAEAKKACTAPDDCVQATILNKFFGREEVQSVEEFGELWQAIQPKGQVRHPTIRIIDNCKGCNKVTNIEQVAKMNAIANIDRLVRIIESKGKTVAEVEKAVSVAKISEYMEGGDKRGLDMRGTQYCRIADYLGVPHDEIKIESKHGLRTLA